MNPMKAGLAGLVMALSAMISPSHLEAKHRPVICNPAPIRQHHRNNNSQYWTNYNLRTFYGYPQFQQPWLRPQSIQPIQVPLQPIINTYSTGSTTNQNAGRTQFYMPTDAVWDIYEAGWPVTITVINKEGKVRLLQRTTQCPQGGNCPEGTQLPYMNGPKEGMTPPVGWHYKILWKE